VRAWREVEAALAADDEARVRAAGKEAGRWYSRTLRARPRVQVHATGRRWPFVHVHRLPPSPILYANAHDGHRQAGHRIRAWWFERRFQRIRGKLMKCAAERLEEQQWAFAYANYDWCAIVGRYDTLEDIAHAHVAVCLWKMGDDGHAEAEWSRARERGCWALMARAELAAWFEEIGIDPSVPGDETTDIDEILEQCEGQWPGGLTLVRMPPGAGGRGDEE
jgi:hypothetical protein